MMYHCGLISGNRCNTLVGISVMVWGEGNLHMEESLYLASVLL